MKVLLLGSGGREAAIAWALARSNSVSSVTCAPGNAGIARHAELLALDPTDLPRLVEHVREAGYDLVVVGPEAPLVAGIADALREIDVPVFGPSAAAARLEGSKAHAKEFMARHGIPTAPFRIFDRIEECESFLRGPDAVYPLVIKADGLAAGKGVLFADDPESARAIAEPMLSGESFGDAGRRIVVERRLAGREVSFFALVDGQRFAELATCQDYKRALDGDRGANTGGMGTYSPSVHLDERMLTRIRQEVVRPTVRGLISDGTPFNGVLFIGLMLTEDGPQVLEYNVRFGDPEAQVLFPRLDGDWGELLSDCARGRLDRAPGFREQAAVCVVMAQEGYPGSYLKGQRIEGLDVAESMPDVVVFHAGTARDEDGTCVTAGGRVLGVTALGEDIAEARQRAYAAVEKIRWNGERHREDIAADALHFSGSAGGDRS